MFLTENEFEEVKMGDEMTETGGLPEREFQKISAALEKARELSGNNVSGAGVEFKNVSLILSGSEILKNITFEIKSSEIHCIVGTNGSGKTSLLRSLLGQMPHTGEIAVLNSKESVIGYMPQLLEFDRTLPITVEDFLVMIVQKEPAFLGLRKEKSDIIKLCLDAVGMEEKRKRLFGHLSGGEKQRVLLSQCLFPYPDLLVLDEPTAGVDAGFNVIFEHIVREMAKSGTTIVWINHDLEQVKRVADSVTHLAAGSVIYSGEASGGIK